jgi:hypothetical protein
VTPGDTFEDPQGRYHLVPPSGWDVDTSGTQGTLAVFTDPGPAAGTRIAPSITLFALPWDGDLESARAQAPTDLAQSGYQLQDVAPLTLTDRTPAYRFEATGEHPQDPGIQLQIVQVMAVRSGTRYVLQGTTETADWPRYQRALEESLTSLDFIG